MITQVLHCPYCQGTDIVRHGTSAEGKQRYRCRECRLGRGRTFLLDYTYIGQSPEVKQQIVDMAMNASGIRDTARVLHVSPTTVINELKKTRAAKSTGGNLPPASRDTMQDHGESADAGSVAAGESHVPAATLARP
jgi:transposase-like protein